MNEDNTFKESPLRSVLKAVTYRIVGTLTTGLLAYAITGNFRVSLTLVAVEPLVKTLVYYAHERIWQQVPRGTVRKLLRSES